MKVAFIDTVHPCLQESLEKAGMECYNCEGESQEDILQKIHEFDGLVIRSRFTLSEDVLTRASNLKWIARSGAGMENIDTKYCEKRGIQLFNAPEGNRTAVGEHAMGMLLSLLNNLRQGQDQINQGIWDREGNRGTELTGKTVGIVGYGNTGSAFAKCLAGFDVQILAHDKYKTGFSNGNIHEATLEDIHNQADVVSLHLPLTEETYHYLNDDFVSQLAKPVYVINTARGKCLDTSALVTGLKSGKILGACLDVLEYEKASFEKLESDQLPADFQFLLESDRVVLSPHVAGWTYESYRKLSEVLATKILSFTS